MSQHPVMPPALEFVFRHFVAICISYRHKDDPPGADVRFAAFSGTVILIRNAVSILTAGHCIAAMEAMFESSAIEVIDTVIADTFAPGRVSDHPIPFDLKNAPRFYIDNDELGLDFGMIHVHRHHARLLAKNGTVAISEENWNRQHEIDFDVCLILGIPEELTAKTLSAAGSAWLRPSVLRVVRTEAPDDVEARGRFVGKIEGNLTLESLSGMSGGPILGFSDARPNTYWIIGIQSAWRPTRGLVFGCPLPTIGNMTTQWIDEQGAAGK